MCSNMLLLNGVITSLNFLYIMSIEDYLIGLNKSPFKHRMYEQKFKFLKTFRNVRSKLNKIWRTID